MFLEIKGFKRIYQAEPLFCTSFIPLGIHCGYSFLAHLPKLALPIGQDKSFKCMISSIQTLLQIELGLITTKAEVVLVDSKKISLG